MDAKYSAISHPPPPTLRPTPPSLPDARGIRHGRDDALPPRWRVALPNRARRCLRVGGTWRAQVVPPPLPWSRAPPVGIACRRPPRGVARANRAGGIRRYGLGSSFSSTLRFPVTTHLEATAPSAFLAVMPRIAC
ncbi:hypothetical protein MC885_003726 [Smutsia gigantea]|nr:hypothetical protein MC885_003726 [Smutsia gigantea]